MFLAFNVRTMAVAQQLVNDHHLADDFVCMQRRKSHCSLLVITVRESNAPCGLETDGHVGLCSKGSRMLLFDICVYSFGDCNYPNVPLVMLAGLQAVFMGELFTIT